MKINNENIIKLGGEPFSKYIGHNMDKEELISLCNFMYGYIEGLKDLLKKRGLNGTLGGLKTKEEKK